MYVPIFSILRQLKGPYETAIGMKLFSRNRIFFRTKQKTELTGMALQKQNGMAWNDMEWRGMAWNGNATGMAWDRRVNANAMTGEWHYG